MDAAELEALLERHAAFWARSSVDRPLLNVSTFTPESAYELRGLDLPMADGTVLSTQDSALTPEMVDPHVIVDVQEYPRRVEAGTSGGPQRVDDLLLTRAPLVKMVWVEAVLGCQVIPKLDTGSIYSVPFLDGPEQVSRILPPENSPWLELLEETTRHLVEDSRGEYQVVQCAQRGPIDLASAVLGHSEMCFAILDKPAELRALTEVCTEAFITVVKAQEALIPPLNGGYCTGYGVWAPGTVVRTQCDVTSSLSAKMYEEHFLPFDVEICKGFDYSVIHLHSGYLHTVDVLLKEKYPTAIQVVLDTGSTPYTVHDLIPVFARILEEKPLILQGSMTPRELDEALEKLPPRGLYVSTDITEAP